MVGPQFVFETYIRVVVTSMIFISGFGACRWGTVHVLIVFHVSVFMFIGFGLMLFDLSVPFVCGLIFGITLIGKRTIFIVKRFGYSLFLVFMWYFDFAWSIIT